jgi:RHS repeat-associated protein
MASNKISGNNTPDNSGVFGNSLIDDATLANPLTESPSPLGIEKPKNNSESYDPFASLNDPAVSKNNATNPTNPVTNPTTNLLQQPSLFKQSSNILPVSYQSTTQNVDVLTGMNQNSPLVNVTSPDSITGNPASSPLLKSSSSSSPSPLSSSSTPPLPNFAIRTEGTISINGNSDLDGNPLDLSDDALIYAAKGFTINGNSTLPVQRDAAGNPIRDASNKLVLVDKAVAVSSGYTVSNGPSNKYTGLTPPPVIAQQTVNVRDYADLRQQELNLRIPTGTPTVTFNIAQNSIRNANDWNSKFPSPGTASNPRVVRVTGGGLTIPTNITLNNYVITVDNGDINFNGNNHNLTNVVLIANNGNISLGNAQARNVAVFASGSIDTNGGARFADKNILASGSSTGTIRFNGATSSTNSSDVLRVISAGDITYNGASNTRGFFTSAKNFTFNGNSSFYGTIGAKGNITFNGQATVIYVADDTTPPVINANLERDTARSGTNSDKITSDPTIVGSITDSNAIVEFRAGFNNTPTANFTNVLVQRNADGSFRFTRTQLEQINGGSLPDGTHTLKLIAKDYVGNTNDIYSFTFTLDTTEPAPTNLDLAASSDLGRSDIDNITRNTTPNITGKANAGALIQLSNNGQTVGQATADSNGNWQITTSTLVNGTYNFTATATDVAGNTSVASNSLQIVVDTVAPASPTNLKLTAATDTGASNSDNITNNVNPTISGNAEANSIVRVFKSGILVGQTTALSNGEWQLQVGTLSNGQHLFTATAEDIAGNVSAPSTQVSITIDTEITTPTLDLIASSDSGQNNSDNITNDSTPTFAGLADAGTTVQLFNNGQLLGQGVANNSGNWEITTNALSNGTYNLTAVATDIAGNVSSPSTTLAVTVDAALPQLILTQSIDAVPLQQNARLIGNVDGTGSSIAALSYRFDNSTEIPISVDNAGRFDQGINFTGIANGQYNLRITAVDVAGNIKINQYNVTVALDNQAPVITATLVRDTAPGNGTNTDAITFDPSITGTVTDASQIVEFKAGFNNTPVENFVSILPQRNSDGSFTLNRSQLETIYQTTNGGALPDGQLTLRLQAKDQFGNTTAIFNVAFTLDTTTPAPTLNLAPTSDSGISVSDKITNDNTPTINGTGEVGATVTLFNNNQQVGQTTVNVDGTWQITTSQLADGVQGLTASVTDIAGNTNTSTTPLQITVDTALPQLNLTTPINQTPLQPGANLAGNINGTGSAITSLSYRFNNNSEIPITRNTTGEFNQELDLTGLSNGVQVLTITAVDAAGNITISQYNTTINIDSTPPIVFANLANDTAPGGTQNTDRVTFDPTITGSVTDASEIIEFFAGFNNTPVGNFINVLPQRNADGTFTLNRSQLETIYGGILPDGIHTLRLIAKDKFNNISDVFAVNFTLDTTTPTPSNLDLPALQDSGVSNSDNITSNKSPIISGNAEALSTVQLFNNGQLIGQATADNTGKWEISTDNLADAVYNLSAIAIDIAGNVSEISSPFSVTVDSTAPTFTLNSPINTAPLEPGARIAGTVNGTGSAITALSYRFNNFAEKTLSFNPDGTFNQQLDLAGLGNGTYTLTVTATDTAGNITTIPYSVTINIDISSPVIIYGLQRDTAAGNTTNNDRITFDPTITGRVTDNNRVVELLAGFNNTQLSNFVDVTTQLQSNGNFTFNRSQLEAINGGTLSDGLHTLRLVAKDEFGNTSNISEYSFTLDTTTLTPTNLDLPANQDSGVSSSDNITNKNIATITGSAEVGATVRLFNNGQLIGEATTNNSGQWTVITNSLPDGSYNLSASAIDIAGNISNISTPLQITIDSALPQISLINQPDTAPLTAGAKLTGSVDGTGSSIVGLSYRFDSNPEITIPFNPTGQFDQALNFTGITNGAHTLTITTTDTAGNIKTIQYNVTVNIIESDTQAPVIAASLANDTAPGNTTNNDRITSDPTIQGSVTDASRVVELRAGFNNRAVADFINITPQLQPDGSFTLNRNQLEAIYGSALADGFYTLRFVAKDEFGNQSNTFSLNFTLDTNTLQPTFNLDAATDSGISGDRKTKFGVVTLVGQAEANATVILEQTGAIATADNTGKFSFSNVSLTIGDNSFIVRSTDIAGNQRVYSTNILRLSPPTAINLTNLNIAENSSSGTVIGQLSSIDPDTGDVHSYSLVDDASGRFQIVGNQLQVKNGTLLNFENSNQHSISVLSTDASGLTRTETFTINVTNVNEAPSFTSIPSNTTIEAGSTFTYNITTSDQDVGDTRTITASGVPSWLNFTDNGNGTATLTGSPNQNQLGLFNIILTVTDAAGLKTTQNLLLGSQITLREQNNFNPTREFPLVVPANPSVLTFKIDPIFDGLDPDSVNDAFEVALVDANGNPIVHTFAKNRDAFFNLTEGEPVGLGAGTSYNSQTRTVSLNLTGLRANTNAKLIFRLVNNDSDSNTNVTITNFAITPAVPGTLPPVQSTFAADILPGTPPNFNLLADVSNSFVAEYRRTSFNIDSKLLYADIAIRNSGSYSVDVPLLVGVKNISDPSVILRNPDGFTPEGIPYYDFSKLISDGKLDPREITDQRSLVFFNPNQVQFTYDVVVLAQLNLKPVIQSQPVTEIIGGQQYSYSVKATDPNGDTLGYKLLVSPVGMTINGTTGLISWNTAANNKGNQSVVVEVSDSRGGVTTQEFTLSVIDTPPNRPPVFTSTPIVDAAINKEYKYDANAVDPDKDEVTYNLVLGPEGMTINSTTGEVKWKPKYENIYGDTVSGRISNPGERDIFTFTMSEGQRIYFDGLKYDGNSSNWNVQIVSPSGRMLVDSDGSHSGPLNLTETGNYRLIISADSGITGDYGFKLLDIDTVPVAAFDKNITGTLNPGTEDAVYRFAGNAGQRLYFDSLSRDTSLDWIIYRADNQSFVSNSWMDIETVLPATSEYILVLRGKTEFNRGLGYTFRIVTPDVNTFALNSLGSKSNPNTQNHAIVEKGEQNVYTFSGTKGQRLYFDMISATVEGTATLISPSGIKYLDQRLLSDGDKSLFSLEEDGIYRLVIDGKEESTGNYSFNLLDAELATAINTDTEIQDTLTPGKETHLYKFTATTGQRLYLDALGNNTSASWTLYGLGNQVINNGSGGLTTDLEIEALPVGGTYILAIQGNSNDPVNYKFNVITPNTVVGGNRNFGIPISGAITEKGERDTYTITGSVGSRIFLDTLIENSGVSIKLISPGGIEVINRNLEADFLYSPVILPESGTYRLIIDGNGETNNSDYSFQLLSSVDAIDITVNSTSPTSGRLEPGSSTKLHKFTGNAGERIYFDSQLTGGNGVFILYGPGNKHLAESAFNLDFEYVLPGNGTYYLIARGDNTSTVNPDGTSTFTDYQIQLISTAASPTPIARNLNDVVSGTGISISKLGEQDIYTYNVTNIGTRIYFDARGNNSNITAKLVSPSGIDVWSGNTTEDSPVITLLETGTYRLVVDGKEDATGSYGFRLANLATAGSTLNLATPVTGNIAAKETTFYTFNSNAGQRLTFDSRNAASNGEWILYAPGNNIVKSASLTEDFTTSLPASGTYILALKNNSATPTSFDIQVTNVAVGSGTTNSSLLNQAGSVTSSQPHTRTFNGVAGTYVYFDNRLSQGYNSGVTLRLLYQGSDVVQPIDASYDNLIQLPNSGQYTLRIEGEGSFDYQLINFGTSSTTQLNFDSTQNNTKTTALTPGYSTQVYRFNGTVGQKIFYDALNSSDPSATVQILTPSGNRIFNQIAQSNSGLIALEEAGTFYLIISRNNDTFSNVSFRLLDPSSTTGSTLVNVSTDIPGSVDGAGLKTNLYRFNNTTPGQHLYFDVKAGTSSYNTWTLHSPTGEKLHDAFLADFELTLPSIGEYVLAVQGLDTTPYNFRIVPSTQLPTPKSLGETISDSINVPGEKDIYTINVTTPLKRVYFDGINDTSDKIYVRLISPSGVEIFPGSGIGAEGDKELFAFDETGTYRIIVDGSDDAIGDYSFRLLDTDINAVQLLLSTPTTKTVAANETVLYKFDTTAGKYLYIKNNNAEGDGYGTWALYSPGNNRVSERFIGVDDTVTLAASGTYILALRGSAVANTFSFELIEPQRTPAENIAVGSNIARNISKPGEEDSFIFAGSIGQRLLLDAIVGTDNLSYKIYSPSGVNIYSDASKTQNDPLTLTETGNYRIVVTGSGRNIGNYEFRLLDLAFATPVTLNSITPTRVELDKASKIQMYKITGTFGQRLYFDLLGDFRNDNGYTGWKLYGEGNQVVASATSYGFSSIPRPDLEVVLPGDGTYILVINSDSNDQDAETYNFQVVTPQTQLQQLTLGNSISGNLSKVGDQHVYTFNGKMGQRLFFDGLLGAVGNNITAKLYSPSNPNEPIQSLPTDSDTNTPFFLTEAGEYRLVIDGTYETKGDYSFRLVDIEDAGKVPNLPLNTPAPVTKNLESDNKVDLYQFQAGVGQQFYFNLNDSDWRNVTWAIYAPNNEIIASPGQISPDLEITTTVAGTYVLAVSSRFGSATSYNFQVATPTTTTNPLELGVPQSGNISKAGEKDEYTFTATKGQRIFFDAISGSGNIYAKIFNPQGVEVASYRIGSDASFPITLTENGTYRLVIDGDYEATGDYSFHLSDISKTTNLKFAESQSGSISKQRVKLYQFNGEAGERLSFDLVADSLINYRWTLYGTNNQVLASPFWSSPDFNVILPASGLYTLAISNNSNEAVNYDFTATKQTPTTVANTGLGVVKQGTIAAGQIATQTFTVSAGTSIYFDILESYDNDAISAELIAPDGTAVFSGQSINTDFRQLNLSQSGTYTLRIKGLDSTSTGDYAYRILELPNVTPDPRGNENSLQMGVQVARTQTSGYAAEVFSFTGIAGQRIFYDGMTPDNGIGYLPVTLFSPTGEQIFGINPYFGVGGANFDSGLFTLTESGTYNLVIAGEQDTPSDFRFRLLDTSTIPELETSKLTVGTLQPGTSTSLYKLTGEKGQRLYLDSISAPGQTTWGLYRADNWERVTNYAAMSNDLSVVLPANGEYILAIEGDSTSTNSYSFQVTKSQDTTAIITPGDGETVRASGDLGTYRVRINAADGKGGIAEQNFAIRVGPEPGNNAPVISTTAVTTGFANRFYKYDVDANDANGDTLTYTLENAPTGMLIDNIKGVITWLSPVAGSHKVAVRVVDGRGGIDIQTYDLIISDAANGAIRGSVYLDKDGNGVRKVTNPGNLTPDGRVKIGDRFKDNYAAYDLGRPKGIPGTLGAMTFKRNADGTVDPNTMLVGGGAASRGGALYEVKVLRGEGGHIIGFDDDAIPESAYYASYFADSPYTDAGLVYTEDGVLLANLWPVSGVNIINPGGAPNATLPNALGGLTFVPTGFGGAGQLKATGKWASNAFYTVNYSQDGTFADGTPRYKIDRLTEETNAGFGPGAFVYVPTTAPNFSGGNSLVMAEWNVGEIAAYEVDSQGNPIASTREVMIDDYNGAWGAIADPVTGDLIFNAWRRFNNIMVVRGLGKPTENEAGLKDWLVFVDEDRDGVRDTNEQFTYTDSQGNYSFSLAAGNYRIVQEVQPGWTQTKPTSPKYWDVTVAANDVKFGIDFGNTNSKLAGENIAPEFTSTALTSVITGDKFSYRATATDLNADDLSYDLVLKPEGMAIAPNGTITWRPGDKQIGKHQVIVRVRDGRGGVDLQAFEVEVKQGNRAPVFTSIATETISAYADKTFQFQATALDLDGDTITYEIIPNTVKPVTPTSATINSTTGLIEWTPTVDEVGGAFNWIYSGTAEPWEILVKATDGKGGSAFQTIKLLVENTDPTAPNRAPVITSKPRTTLQYNNAFLYRIEASDPDGDRLTYSLDTKPDGMIIENGFVTWTPTVNQFDDINTVVLRVSDERGGFTTQQFTIGFNNIATNRAPEITSTPQQITNLEREYQYNLAGTDADGDFLLWSLDSAPQGMVIDATNGSLRWKPSAEQLGEHIVRVRLTDAYGLFVGQEFSLFVNGTNTPPQISSTPKTIAGVNQQYTYQVVASDPEGDKLTYTLGKSPLGMTIDDNGVIRWTPSDEQLQAYTVEVIVTDSSGASALQSYTIEVARQQQNGQTVPVTVNNAPSITSSPVFLANTNRAYQYQVLATDPDAGDSLTYQLLSSVPSGMTINATTGMLTWANPVAGTYSVIVGAVDRGGLGAAQRFTLTARANSNPVISSTGGTTVAPGSTYAYDVKAFDAEGDALTYTLDQISRDKGITIDTLGRIRWNPTLADATVNPHAVIVTVADSNGGSASETINLSVARDTIAPVVRLIALNSTVNLGEDITFQARATDNVRVAGLQLLVDGTPVTLDANGIGTVKASRAGTFNAIAKATDTSGNLGQATFDVFVVDPSDVDAPTVSFKLEGVNDGDFVTAPTKIRATITDDGQLDYYRLLVAPIDGGEFRELWRNDNPTAINDGLLADIYKFDPSLLQNDSYVVRLEVADNGGKISYSDQIVDVAGELKLGNFRLSFTDLTVPVTGIPITLTRTYDTLTTGSIDDFGYGWRMEFRDTDLRTSLRRDENAKELEKYDRYTPFKRGTKVYITLPGGKREAFTFKPVLDPESASLPYSPESLRFYNPVFVGEKGVTSKLTVKNTRLFRSEATGGTFFGGVKAYNPADPYFGGTYELTTKEGIVYEIDAKTGDLLTATDTNGNKLTYTDQGIFSSTGQKITFERDAQGRIASVLDPMGELIRYEYDELGNLISVTDQEKNETKLIYDTDPRFSSQPGTRRPHYLREIIDPLQRSAAKVEYDDNGRLKQTLNAANNAVNIEYDLNNSLQIIKDSLGNPTGAYEYDSRGNVVRAVDGLGNETKMKYDDESNLIEVKNPNNLVTKYEYDQFNNLKSRTEEYCGCASVTPGKTYYDYDIFGNMTNLVLSTGASMSMSYDKAGNLLEMKDGFGNVIQKYTYYSNGLVRTQFDETGLTLYRYDEYGNVSSTYDFASGQTTAMEYNASGNLKKMTQDKGTADTNDDEIFTFEHDKLGREKFADYGNGIWVKYDYEGAGGDWTKLEAPTIGKMERKLTADGKLAGWVTPNGGTPTFKYDFAGRLFRETDTSGNDITEYGYDAAGRLTSVKDLRTGAVSSKKYDAGGRVIEEIDPTKSFIRYKYNTRTGRLDSTERGKYKVDAAGEIVLDASNKPVVDTTVPIQTFTYEYNGNRTTVIDPLGRRTTRVTDEYYLPTETIYQMRDGSIFKEKTEYLYTSNLQEAKDYPTRVVDIGGNDRVFEYDDQGRLKSATDLGNGKYIYTYGDNGLEKITGPTSEKLEYKYDALGNLEKVIYGNDTSKRMTYRASDNRLQSMTLPSGETVEYDYFESGQIKTQTTKKDGVVTGATGFTYTQEGAVKTITDDTGTTTYRYDSNNRLEGMDYSNGSSISYTYDFLGRVKTVTEKGSATATAYTTEYDYDAFGNLSWIKDPAQGITTMKYDVVNRLKERTMPNGVKTTYEYNDLDRIKSIVHTNAQGQVLASVTYERKGIGEPSKITREDGSYTKLEYDDALRVKKESYYNAANTLLNETTYTYDAAGKRQVQSSTTNGNRTFTYTPGYQLDTVQETGETENYDYDTDGRLTLISRDGKTLDLEHDTYDRLTEVENETTGEKVKYIYDGQGNRVKAVKGSQERRFLVAPAMGGGLESTDLITDGSGNLISNYIYGGGSSPFMRLDANGNAVYYLTDAMGTVIGLANGSGQSTGKFLYDAFGNVLSQVGGANTAAGGDFRFQGQWLENESGLYHFRARDYDPKTGLFLSRDPVDIISTEPESFNPYQFVYNNPYVYSDPTGMFTITELNAAQDMQTALSAVKNYAGAQAKEYLKQKIGDTFGEIVTSVFSYFVPGGGFAGELLRLLSAGDSIVSEAFEIFLVDKFCEYFEGIPLINNLRLYPRVGLDGEPLNEGVNCARETEYTDPRAARYSLKQPGVNPEFIFVSGKYRRNNPGGYLIGDIKITQRAAYEAVVNNQNQWQAMSNYAREWQLLPFVSYISFVESAFGKPGVSKSDKQRMADVALRQGVVLVLANLID